MEALIASLGNYPVLQLVGAVVVIVAGILAMRKGARDSKNEPLPVTEVDLLRLHQNISEEQSQSRKRIYDSIAGVHNDLAAERDRRNTERQVQTERVHALENRVTALEAAAGRRR